MVVRCPPPAVARRRRRPTARSLGLWVLLLGDARPSPQSPLLGVVRRAGDGCGAEVFLAAPIGPPGADVVWQPPPEVLEKEPGEPPAACRLEAGPAGWTTLSSCVACGAGRYGAVVVPSAPTAVGRVADHTHGTGRISVVPSPLGPAAGAVPDAEPENFARVTRHTLAGGRTFDATTLLSAGASTRVVRTLVSDGTSRWDLGAAGEAVLVVEVAGRTFAAVLDGRESATGRLAAFELGGAGQVQPVLEAALPQSAVHAPDADP